ncbi:DUF3298 domain-containing protein [Chengkuizengella sediminis]|uniref:DUF3298 domain-containing protein n=1 Tax=Chengkuizengella sediminis TaxID=1885917 RepID=UPI00138A54ED|nr:DUF3298 domain-containing protein [Chengkuizengella sediminis]NDI36545.1 DUF3298 domain-containing protein [Chengkuizengella sediminis]
MKKTAILLTLSGTLLFGGIQFSLANSSISSQPIAMELALFDLQQSSEATVESKEYTSQNEYVVVEGELPVVKGLKDEIFQKKVNEQIKQFVEQKKAEVEKQSKLFNDEQKELGDDAISGPHDSPTGPYSLFINYEVKISGNMVSIVFKTYTMGYIAANGINEVDSINIIDDTKGHIVELEHFVTDKEKLNQLIQKEIESNDQLFKDSFESVREDQGYYVENDQLNVVFNEYEIAAGYVGTPTITIPLDQLEIAKDYEKSQISVESKTLSIEEDLVVISGELPVLKGITNKELQKSVEAQIDEIYQIAKDEIEKEVSELIATNIDTKGNKLALHMSYDVKENQDELLSVIITTSKYTIAGSGMQTVQSINLKNDAQGQQFQISDIVNDQEQLIKLIQAEIDQDTDKYFQQELTSLREDLAFYTESEQLVLIFNEYEIAAGYVGTPVIKIPLSKLSTVSEQNNDDSIQNEKNKVSYYTKTVNEAPITMLSLRDLGKHFDYKVIWEPQTKSVILFKDMTQISVKEGDREVFIDDDKSEVLELESASYKNRVYVPISFTEIVLGETITLDEKNEIKFEN